MEDRFDRCSALNTALQPFLGQREKAVDEKFSEQRIAELQAETTLGAMSQISENALLQAKNSSSAEGSQLFQPFENVTTDGRTFASCEKMRLFTSNWSEIYAHGAHTVLPILTFAENILQSGEKVDAVAKISWRRPTTNNLQFVLYDEASDHSFEKDKPNIFGELQTSQGRKLKFFGKERQNDPINYHFTAVNPFPEKILELSDITERDGIFSIKLQQPPVDMISALDTHRPLLASTLVDIITLSLLSVYKRLNPDRELEAAFLCKVEHLSITDKISELLASGSLLEIKLPQEQALKTQTGLRVSPFQYRFSSSQSAFSDGLVAGQPI